MKYHVETIIFKRQRLCHVSLNNSYGIVLSLGNDLFAFDLLIRIIKNSTVRSQSNEYGHLLSSAAG